MIKYAGMDSVKTLLRGVFEAKEEAFKVLMKLLGLPFEESREILYFANSVREKFCGQGILLRAIVELIEIGRARVGKECRSRWSPYH